MLGTVQGQVGTKQGQCRDRHGQTMTNKGISFLSVLILTCPCLSMIFPACPCLSLYVSTFAIPSCLPLQMNKTVFISMNIVTLTFLAKATVPMHENFVFNFFFTFHLDSSFTFNPISSILVVNIMFLLV